MWGKGPWGNCQWCFPLPILRPYGHAFGPDEAVLGLERDESSFCGKYFPSGNEPGPLSPLNSETGMEGNKKKERHVCVCARVRMRAHVHVYAHMCVKVETFLPATEFSALPALSDTIVPTTLWKKHHYPHFTDEKVEGQRFKQVTQDHTTAE